jgi:S-DNA-T family DNA segregation ATPase FtsK/SpoIIIE
VDDSDDSGQKTGVNEDPLLEEVRQMASEHDHLSVSFLQRRLRIGYPRAARLMDILQQEGTVPHTPPKDEG